MRKGEAAWTAMRVVGVIALMAAVVYAIFRVGQVDSRQDADQALRDYRACMTSDESRAAIRQGFARLADANLGARAEAGADDATLREVRRSSDLFLAQLKEALPPRNCDPLLPGARAELAAISGAVKARRARAQDAATARRLARRDPLTAPIASRGVPDPDALTRRPPAPAVRTAPAPAPRPASPSAPASPAPADPSPAPAAPSPPSPAPAAPAPAPPPTPAEPPIVTLSAIPGLPAIEVGPILGTPPLVGG